MLHGIIKHNLSEWVNNKGNWGLITTKIKLFNFQTFGYSVIKNILFQSKSLCLVYIFNFST